MSVTESNVTESNVTEFDPTAIKLTEIQVECLTFIEQVHALESVIPSADRLAEVFGRSKQTIKKWLDSPEFQYILKGKGIIRAGTAGVLSAPQMMVVNMLLNIGDRRSDREKCEAAGITPAQLAAWRRDPEFIGYMRSRAEKMFKDSDDVAYLNILKNMQGGDLQAAKFYLEMTGKYQPSMRLDVNIDMILARVIEILQVRVHEPEVLELIAKDFEELMSGVRGPSTFAQEQSAIPAHAQEVSGHDLSSFGGLLDLDLS